MKKLLCVIMTLCLLISVAYAEETTEKRNIFDFNMRVMEYLEETKDAFLLDASFNDVELDGMSQVMNLPYELADGSEYCAVSLPIGMITVSYPSFEIEELEVCVYSEIYDDENAMIVIARAVSAMAALEYERSENRLYETLYLLDKTRPASVIVEALDIFNAGFDEALGTLFRWPEGEIVPMYTGNYEYFLRYHIMEDEKMWIYMVAEER